MDPNAALRKARKALQAFLSSTENTDECEAQAQELADAFEALDGWLSKGGFLPDAWRSR